MTLIKFKLGCLLSVRPNLGAVHKICTEHVILHDESTIGILALREGGGVIKLGPNMQYTTYEIEYLIK